MATFLVYSRVNENGASWLTESRIRAESKEVAMALIAARHASHTPTHAIRVR